MANENNENKENKNTIILATDVLPDIITILPLTQRPVFPGMMIPLLLSGRELVMAINEIYNTDHKIGGVALVKKYDPADPDWEENLYSVGCTVKILKVSQSDENNAQVMLSVMERFSKSETLQKQPIVRWRVIHHYEKETKSTDEMKAYSMAIISSVKELLAANPMFQEEFKMFMSRFSLDNPGKLADFVTAMTSAEAADVQEILETFDIRKRVEKVMALLHKEIELNKMQKKISQSIQDKMSAQQKEFFLKEQLKAIKKELGIEKDEKSSEIEKFQERIKDLVLTEEAQKRIDEELEKLQVLEPHSAEYGVSRNYLDWLTSLPWGKFSEDNYDIKKAKSILDRDHYGLDDIKERILEFISTGKMKGSITGSIMLFVGPPGVGKTSIGKSVAAALNRKFFRFSLGGMRDEAEIMGHRRTYIGAMPGKIMQSLKTVGVANPVIMLDEIDKIGSSFQGDPASALLEVLDPEQNVSFLDHFIDVRFDLSNVLFIATANQLDTIPGPLLDRMEVMSLSGYVLKEKIEIAKRYLIPKLISEHGLKKSMVSIDSKAVKAIIEGYAREAGVRSLENNLKKIMRKTAMRFAEGNTAPVKVTEKNIEEFIGKPRFSDDSLYDKQIPGVVMGLAWTSMGGTTLYIEATAVDSKTKGFKQTGQLGDVMKESSEIAYTYISSRAKDYGIDPGFFENNTIHLHVPAGATPKDGPSAGVTMATALYSLAKNKPIKKRIAMTGELTITGKILPIGGLKEKTIAAKRANVKTIIFPYENKKDFDEIPDYIKSGLTAYPVNYFDEILKIVY